MATGKKILVVDDDRLVLGSVTATLEAAGHRVWATDSPQEAVELVGTVEPDVVVTDLRMPGLDGVSLLERLMVGGARVSQMLIYSATQPPADEVSRRAGGAEWVPKAAGHQALVAAVGCPSTDPDRTP